MAATGFRFRAPAGWRVDRGATGVTVTKDSELLRVATFTLVKPYRAELFDRVARELAARMADVARQTGGSLGAARVVTVDGIRSHAYRVTVGDHVDEYTFVLAGTREYQLLCRRKSSSGTAFCDALLTSFVRA